MLFKGTRLFRLNFSVEICREGLAFLTAEHHRTSSRTFAPSADRKLERARERRDITVPTGTSSTCAISRYDISSTSQRRMICR